MEAKEINKKLCLGGKTYCTGLQIIWSALCNSEDVQRIVKAILFYLYVYSGSCVQISVGIYV